MRNPFLETCKWKILESIVQISQDGTSRKGNCGSVGKDFGYHVVLVPAEVKIL